jgi:hypothetical protein
MSQKARHIDVHPAAANQLQIVVPKSDGTIVRQGQVAVRAATDQDERLLKDSGFSRRSIVAPANRERDRLPASAGFEERFEWLTQGPY